MYKCYAYFVCLIDNTAIEIKERNNNIKNIKYKKIMIYSES